MPGLFIIAPKLEATKMSFNSWMDKLWYIYTMEYYSAMKKEGNPAICNNMDETGGHNVK